MKITCTSGPFFCFIHFVLRRNGSARAFLQPHSTNPLSKPYSIPPLRSITPHAFLFTKGAKKKTHTHARTHPAKQVIAVLNLSQEIVNEISWFPKMTRYTSFFLFYNIWKKYKLRGRNFEQLSKDPKFIKSRISSTYFIDIIIIIILGD